MHSVFIPLLHMLIKMYSCSLLIWLLMTSLMTKRLTFCCFLKYRLLLRLDDLTSDRSKLGSLSKSLMALKHVPPPPPPPGGSREMIYIAQPLFSRNMKMAPTRGWRTADEDGATCLAWLQRTKKRLLIQRCPPDESLYFIQNSHYTDPYSVLLESVGGRIRPSAMVC